MKPIDGKIAVVTGASRGIGRAIALRLAKDGALVSVHYSENEKAADETVREIELLGGQAFTIQHAFGLENKAEAFFEKLDSKLQATTRTGVITLIFWSITPEFPKWGPLRKLQNMYSIKSWLLI